MPYPVDNAGTVEVSDRTPVAIKTDNLIRQRLRIGDPRDVREIAAGLKRRFAKDARALAAEAEGFPVLPSRFAPALVRPTESLATGAELKQAIDYVSRDLQALIKDHRLKGIGPELRGWEQAIHTIIADGTAAARLALDPLARDRLFGARRDLYKYARLARLVGALTQTMSIDFRGLARSLDVVASLLLVLAGEVLAGAGLGGGRFLLSVPASELQARRDAVLMALRTLAGTTEQTFGNDQWPWSLHGLREVLRAIETSGHLDLRALLEEPVLGKLMDDLIERAAQQDINGLRALGATADVVVERLHRLMLIIDNKVQPQAPAVMTLLKALQLFLDAFAASRSGYRILFVARAPIGFYGLGGIGGPDPATRRLLDLVIERGRLAELLDCYLGCECCSDDIICQIVLDKLLYDVDRAIDLYTLGSDPSGNGTPERRAVAFAALIQTFLQAPINVFPRGAAVPKRVKCLEGDCFPGVVDITSALGRIVATLRQVFPLPFPVTKDDKALLTDELCMQQLADDRLEALIATLAPGCLSGQTVLETLSDLVKRTILIVDNQHGDCKDITIVPPPTTEDSLRLFKRLDSLWP